MTDDELNRTARFLAPSDGEGGAPPGIEIAGVLVLAYFEDGELHISVDCEGAEDSVLVDGARVPTRFLMNGVTTLVG